MMMPPPTAPVAQPAGRLADLSFSDLFVSTNTAAPTLASRLSGPGLPADASPPVSALPEAYARDAGALLDAVERRWAEERFADEFTLKHDDVFYRCARIGAPEAAALPRSSEEAEARVWCLRRIEQSLPRLDALGLKPWLQDELRRLAPASGLLLVAGAFGSGKSTTAAACLHDWVTTRGGVGVTLEDPPEKPLHGYHAGGPIFQIPVRSERFAEAVKASRRWAYRYFMMGELRSTEAAQQLLQVALSGPLAITTIHGSGPIEALMAFSKFASPPTNPGAGNDQIASAILGVLHQSLTRRGLEATYLSFTGRNAAAMRNLLIMGQFHKLGDELEQQKRMRALGRPSEAI